ncbi:MAG TPA: hypothetical protein VGI16_05795 [Candidatus Acidoferrum sp.]|jgi:hypothetical protein
MKLHSILPLAAATTLLAAVAFTLPNPTFAQDRETSRHSHSFSAHNDSPVADCSGLHIRMDHQDATIQSEERNWPRSQAPVLRMEEKSNGGVQLQGWDQNTYSVTTCKAAVGNNAQQLLSQIKVSVNNGEVSVSGPEQQDDWTVFLLIRTPRNAEMDLTTRNGPISFYSVDGKIASRATNGPISMKDCSGEAEINATNGPISFIGSNGKLRIHTQNGPISISLNDKWNGSELVADAVNGPVTLSVPAGFQSSFVVESSGNGPVSCQASVCGQSRKTWDEDHKRIEFGSGSPVIHLSTVNGPVSVRNSHPATSSDD